MCALPSRFIKERNKVSKHRRTRHGWFQRWLVVERISVKAGKTGKRMQRQSANEGIIKKVKADDAERRLTKQRQRMANHRTSETGKQRYQQVISIIGSLLSVNIFVFSSPVKLQTVDSKLHTSSTYYQSARRTSCACAYSCTISYARHLSELTPSYSIFIAFFYNHPWRLYNCGARKSYRTIKLVLLLIWYTFL